jgi:hypothetical protein
MPILIILILVLITAMVLRIVLGCRQVVSGGNDHIGLRQHSRTADRAEAMTMLARQQNNTKTGSGEPTQLPTGSPQLPSGSPPLPTGSPQLPTGSPPLPTGSPPLPTGSPPLPTGDALIDFYHLYEKR